MGPLAAPRAISSRLGHAVAELLDRRRRLTIALCMMAAVILLAGLAVHLIYFDDLRDRLGVDFRQYMEATRSWAKGGDFYHSWQLSGPYEMPRDEYRLPYLPVLYPPPALLLFLPFALVDVLAVAWWCVPALIVAWTVFESKPAPWTWPLLTLCLLGGDTIWLTLSGNPVMWTTAAVALGCRLSWPSVAVLIKPTLAPFALVGAQHRSWWTALAICAVISVPFGAMWLDYWTALTNATGSGWWYSLNNVPMMLIPLVAWAGRTALRGEG